MRDVLESLADRGRLTPDRPVLDDAEETVGWRALGARVDAACRSMPDHAATVAISGPEGIGWVVADLAASVLGRRVVPVPSFFSPGQVAHLVADAGVDLLLHPPGHPDPRVPVEVPRLALERPPLGASTTSRPPAYAGGAERVVYTSGTTGKPKGVVHGDRQLEHAIGALASAAGASDADHHLTALPYALLLEQIAGIFLPLLVGARASVRPGPIGAALGGDVAPIGRLLGRIRPTTTVLVPRLLAGLVALGRVGRLSTGGRLRLAAVGGAPVPGPIVRAARELGIPVRRGYGLSECCAVAALERADSDDDPVARPALCGRPLPGLEITLEDGEIVIAGPTVMNGYLGRPPLGAARWRTGDLGRLGRDGELEVLGRRDRRLVLADGRNVAPEWVEAAVLCDPRVRWARLAAEDGAPILDLVPEPATLDWADGAEDVELRTFVEGLLAALPRYAWPVRARWLDAPEAPCRRGVAIAPTMPCPTDDTPATLDGAEPT
ncbi:MAG: AMP-binding protein [Ectothiorhodospiraceae bacterium]|nr:AMP-binding protein [Ectothiorhodospiraceae bacterium]